MTPRNTAARLSPNRISAGISLRFGCFAMHSMVP